MKGCSLKPDRLCFLSLHFTNTQNCEIKAYSQLHSYCEKPRHDRSALGKFKDQAELIVFCVVFGSRRHHLADI